MQGAGNSPMIKRLYYCTALGLFITGLISFFAAMTMHFIFKHPMGVALEYISFIPMAVGFIMLAWTRLKNVDKLKQNI